jgi:uncharacterized protein (TIGR03067 family)
MPSQDVRRSAANVLPELRDHPQYQVVRELGRGGMGVVYLARNKIMDRFEVLKVVKAEILAKADVADRFLREIRAAAKLNHPNIVTAYSAFQAGDVLVFAMEYVEGVTLAQLIGSQGRLPVANACHYVQQVCLGLQHALDKGMVHRDIKPHNLILSKEGKKHVVKILDFGLAKATREGQAQDRALTATGMMLGTPDYIAPEQTLDAAKADHRADIYSLGCTFYYLLAGKPPFDGGSMYQILQAHHQKEAQPLNEVRDDVPAELAAVVARMMAKDPAARYQNASAIVPALAPYVKAGLKAINIPVPPPPASPAPHGTLIESTETLSRPSQRPAARSARREATEPVAAEERGRKPWLLWGLIGGGAGIVLLAGIVALVAVLGSRENKSSSGSGALASSSSGSGLGSSISSLSSAGSPSGTAVAGTDDLEHVQGTWIITRGEVDGQEIEDLSTGKLTFRGNVQNLSTRNSPNNEVRFWLKPESSPKQYDVTDKSDKVIYRGIYRLDGDNLSFCWGTLPYAATRPEDFRTTAGSNLLAVVLTRSLEARVRALLSWDGDLPAEWNFVGMKKGVRVWSDRAYLVDSVAKELEDGILLMRNKDDKDWLPGQRFRALRDCSAYAVLQAKRKGAEELVDAATLRALADDGWIRTDLAFEPSFHDWEWVVLKKTLKQGVVIGDLKPGIWKSTDVFFVVK